MDVLDDTNSYKKLYSDMDKFFTDHKSKMNNINNARGVDPTQLSLLEKNLEEYKNLNNTRIEKLVKLIDINSQNNKNNSNVIESIKSDVDGYKKLNDGRVEKLTKLFLLLNK